MEIKLDLRSLVIGLIMGLMVIAVVAASNFVTEKSDDSGAGRYKMLVNEKRAYILDSTTGRSWSVSSTSGAQDREDFWKSKVDLPEDSEKR